MKLNETQRKKVNKLIKSKQVYTSLYINEEEGIIAEQVFDNESRFCIYNSKTNEVT